ncbi:MAG: glycosyltransferase family 4 protein [Candidatus Marinimicrobia bacterium]|nr:glycosyltransferase family 4 protein [Candidatus Neomarinimicrobiota bacterium]
MINSSKKWGGNERWSVSAAEGLAQRGHEVFLIGPQLFHSQLSPKVFTFPMNITHELDLLVYLKLVKIILKENIEIIIPTRRKEYFMAGIIGKVLGIPVFFRLGIVRKFPKNKLLSRAIYGKLPTGIICNSQEIKNQLLTDEVLSATKIHVVYNGYQFNKLSSISPSNEYFTFACAGRLTSQKGFDILLQAVKILREKSNRFHVKIAGEGPLYRQMLTYIQENGLQNNVELLGHISNVVQLFSRADAVVIPSRNEGIPNVLMEAWSQKKTVIAARSAGIPEAIVDHNNGILTNLDPESLAQKLFFVMHNDTRNLGESGYETLHQKFTLDKMLIALESVFNLATHKDSSYEEIKI